MNSLMHEYLMFRLFAPNFGLLLLWVVKLGGLVLLGCALACLLRNRSAAARCWVWRCTLLGCLAAVGIDFMPVLAERARLLVPIPPPAQPSTMAWANEDAPLRIVRTSDEFENLLADRKAAQLAGAEIPPPWDKRRIPTSRPADRLRAPLDVVERHLITAIVGVAGGLAVLSLIRLTLGLLWLRKGSATASEETQKLCDDAASRLNLRGPMPVWLSGKVGSPLLAGLWQPRIYLPVAAVEWSEAKLEAVFLHELAHVKRGDHHWQILCRFTNCVFWWNPLVPWVGRRIRDEAEQAADDGVLLHQQVAADYAEALVEIASVTGATQGPRIGVSMIGHRPLERRIRAMMVENPWRGRVGGLAGSLILMLALAAIANASVKVGRSTKSMRTLAMTPAPSWSPQERATLERVLANAKKRSTDLRRLHYRAESTVSSVYPDRTETYPEPSKMEAWVDAWAEQYRVEFRPQVTEWIGGVAPYNFENSTEISDGRRAYLERDPLRSITPRGVTYDAGVRQNEKLIELLQNMLRTTPLRGNFKYSLSDTERDGRALLQIQYNATDWKQQEIYLVDPAREDFLIVQESGVGDQPASQWLVEEIGTANNGALYAARTKWIHGANPRSISETRITFLETLEALPPGILSFANLGEKTPAPADDAVRPESLTLRFVSNTGGTPIEGVQANVSINGVEQPMVTNAEGEIVIPLPDGRIEHLRINATKPGFVRRIVAWREMGNAPSVPARYQVRLSPGLPISGRIVDEAGEPLAGAEVKPYRSAGGGTAFMDAEHVSLSVKTDAEGRWQAEDLPADLSGMDLTVSAPGYQTIEINQLRFRARDGASYAALRLGTAVITLPRGLELTGRVVDPQNEPVANCRLVIGRDIWGTDAPELRTDAEGRFRFTGLQRGEITLTAESSKHMPWTSRLSLPRRDELAIQLAPGKVTKGRVVMPDGTPCVNLVVTVDKWNALRTLTYSTKTDAEGRFAWNGAPEEPVKFFFRGEKVFLYGVWLKARGKEHRVVMKPALDLNARVVDAKTGQPISVFRLISGRVDGWRHDPIWNHENAKTFRDGQFQWNSAYLDYAYTFRLEADGYEPLRTKDFRANQSKLDKTFKLVPKK